MRFSTGVPFKTLTTQHQYWFPLINIGKKMIWDPIKKEIVHQFHVCYMTHRHMKKHRTHKEQVIKKRICIQISHSKVYQKRVIKRKVSVLSLIMFYENRKILMYKVIRKVIYTIIDDYICLYYLDLLQKKWSKYNNNFKIISSMICLVCEYLRFWWILCHVMGLLKIQYQHLSWHVAMTYFHIIF